MNTQVAKPRRIKINLLLAPLLLALAMLSACDSVTPQAPALGTTAQSTSFEFQVDPRAEKVTLGKSAATSTPLQTQAEGSRVLVPNVDIGIKDLSFQFKSPKKLIVRFRIENITDTSSFAQPFSFTLNSDSKNIVKATAPLVSDKQLGGDGVLSPGEVSKRFRFEVIFKKGKPFSFLVDTRAAVTGGTNTACTDPVSIPDERLEAEIRQALGKLEGELTCEDLASLRELNAVGFVVDDNRLVDTLEGLQFAVNLTNLDVSRNRGFFDLSPLSGLTNLTSLNLNGNNLGDLSSLAKLTNLTLLDLGVSGVSDISPLENLTQLTDLNLSGNDVSDIDLLSNFTKLTTLRLDDNTLSDLRPLEDLTELTSLNLDNTTVSDIGPLENLTNLTNLNLRFNSVSDIGSLENLSNLTNLRLDSNGVSDISPLANLTNLSELFLGFNDISDLGPLENLTNLSELFLDDSGISDISSLAGLTNLTLLDLDNNTISDISPLENLTNLTNLDLSFNTINDISALVDNSGLDIGDFVALQNNPLSPQALEDVETLRERDVNVFLGR